MRAATVLLRSHFSDLPDDASAFCCRTCAALVAFLAPGLTETECKQAGFEWLPPPFIHLPSLVFLLPPSSFSPVHQHDGVGSLALDHGFGLAPI